MKEKSAESRLNTLQFWKNFALWTILALALLAVDLVTKFFAQIKLKPIYPEGVAFLPGFIELRYIENPAIAFGIGGGNAVFMTIITVVTFILIPAIAALAFTVFKRSRSARIALSFIEAGAIGNLVDRLTFNYVRDFLDMSAFKPFAWLGWEFNFGVCNVADYFITIGAVVLLFIILFIGPQAVFPLKKSWREEAKRAEQARKEEAHRADD